jgi:hypothetical protein
MGERADGMTPRREDQDDREPGAPHRIEEELSSIREEIGDLLRELDRRRREMFDVRLQLRRHPIAIPVAGIAVAGILGGAVALLARNDRHKQPRRHKARQIRRALGRMVDHPERVARGEPPPSEKILVAIGTAVAAFLVKRALAQAVPRPAHRKERAAAATALT